jgi:hypothetical protein
VDKLRAEIKEGKRGHKMHSHSADNGPSIPPMTVEIELEPRHLFENQWNSTKARVFDWFQHYEWQGAQRARGHWLEMTDEMLAARRETVHCGYCGKQYGPLHEAAPQDGFCDACLDSPYLKESEIYMLRLRTIEQDWERGEDNEGGFRKRVPLTTEEKDRLVPRYIARQTTGNDSRAKKARDQQRERVLAEFEKTTKAATTERDGMLWLWDKGFSLNNVIYYSHTDKFGFGWRSDGVDQSVADKLLEVISEFPFDYEIKVRGGKSYARP